MFNLVSICIFIYAPYEKRQLKEKKKEKPSKENACELKSLTSTTIVYTIHTDSEYSIILMLKYLISMSAKLQLTGVYVFNFNVNTQ